MNPSNFRDWRLVATEVTVQYEDATVITLENLEVTTPRSVALVGPSGAGKTSLLTVLGGLRPPSSGVVTFLDGTGGTHTPQEASGWIVQSNGLLRHRNALENVRLGALMARAPIARDSDDALGCLAQVSLEHRANTLVKSLSVGELRRLAVARSLMMNRPFLFADEPTAGLDTRSTSAVLEILFAKSGRALIVATHDPAIVDRCDNYVVVDSQSGVAL